VAVHCAIAGGSVILGRMAEKNASLFSFPQKARGADVGTGAIVVEPHSEKRLTIFDIGEGVKIPGPTADAHFPYEKSWNEFDRLQRYATAGSFLNWGHWLFGGFNGGLSFFDHHNFRRLLELTVFLAVVVTAVFTAVRARWAKTQLAHWPCPRCNAEWPGKKSEKDPRCATCGLKLGQLAA